MLQNMFVILLKALLVFYSDICIVPASGPIPHPKYGSLSVCSSLTLSIMNCILAILCLLREFAFLGIYFYHSQPTRSIILRGPSALSARSTVLSVYLMLLIVTLLIEISPATSCRAPLNNFFPMFYAFFFTVGIKTDVSHSYGIFPEAYILLRMLIMNFSLFLGFR